MKLYNSIGPNPKTVRMFIAERGIGGIERQDVDLIGGENRQAEHVARNPMGQTPALQLDDGSYLTEITAICEYLDETASGGTSLIGSNAKERGETRMWTRRIDLNIAEPLGNGFRFAEGLRMFRDRVRCIPQAADDLKLTARENLAWLDRQIAGRTFICGERLTLADILLFAFLEFAGTVGQKLDASNTNLVTWYERMASRPSASA